MYPSECTTGTGTQAIFVAIYRGLLKIKQFYSKENDPSVGADLVLQPGEYTIKLLPTWLPNRKRDFSIRVFCNERVTIG